MGVSLPPDELVVALSEQWPGREPQIRQLAALLSVSLPIPGRNSIRLSHSRKLLSDQE
jgi:hypothetical protein